VSLIEGVKLKSKWFIHKFKDPEGKIAKQLQNGAKIEDIIQKHPEAYIGQDHFEGNIALNEGLQAIIDLICGLATPTKWDASNARLGVGDGTTAESATQTGLQGTNKYWKTMDSGYPTRSNQTAIWRATFDGTEANFAWNEFTVVNAADDTGINLNRKVSAKGTKSSGETWTLELQITFS
jgi:hypothetical protein